jgi:nucleotide-binding universal stress UspA family protein
MSYKSILVNLQLGKTNGGALAVAGDLAERFNAHVLGVAMYRPVQVCETEAYLMSDLAARDREGRQREIAAAEHEFRVLMEGRAKSLGWHSGLTNKTLAAAVVDHARSADLLVAGADRNKNLFDTPSSLGPGDLVMQAGRPVFVVPDTVERLSLDHVLIGWKDGPEARRAIADALPLLTKAGRVTVVEVAPEADLASARSHLNDVVEWLGRHGVSAEALPVAGADAPARLRGVSADLEADLIVAGAYAHSRLQEWIMGGVTRDLLLHTHLCSMVSR